VVTIITIVAVKNLDCNDLDLNSLKESNGKTLDQSKLTCCNGQHNSGGFHCKNNWHVSFFKPPSRPNLDSKILNLDIQPFLEHIFMHLNMVGFNPQGDHNQAYPIQ
jgi:hypothetical protein